MFRISLKYGSFDDAYRLNIYLASINENALIIANVKPLSFVYLSRFVNVKPLNRKEVDHERLKNCPNLVGLSQSSFEKKYRKAYEWTIGKFCDQFGDIELLELTVDKILSFLNQITEGRKPQTTALL